MRKSMISGLAAAASLSASAAGAVVPISGLAQVRAEIFAFDGEVRGSNTKIAAQWSGTPSGGTATAYARLLNDGPSGSVAAAVEGATTANWNHDGMHGQVDFNWGWKFDTIGDVGLVGASYDQLNPNWSYTFRAEHDGRFIWESEIRPNRHPTMTNFGLSGWNLQLNGATVIDTFDPTGAHNGGDSSGIFALRAGETYTFSVVNGSNIAGRSFGDAYIGVVAGTFWWTIQEFPAAGVPEPSVWALMIGGLGMVGVALRRRRAIQL